MGLDGIFLRSLILQFKDFVGARVEKIVQPSGYEIVIFLKKFGKTKKLFISASSKAPAIYFSEKKFNGIYKNFNFQELLKNRLKSAFFSDVVQQGLDRVLYLKFSARDYVGEEKRFCLCVELISRYSNIILYDEDSNKIEDAIKRVSIDSFFKRPVLPKFPFIFLKSQKKLDITQNEVFYIAKKIFEVKEKRLDEAFSIILQGMSVFVAKVLATSFNSKFVENFDDDRRTFVFEIISWLKNLILEKKFEFCLIIENGKVKDYLYFDPSNFINSEFCKIKKFSNPSEMLDYYYEDLIFLERQTKKENGILKFLRNEISKIEKRIEAMGKDLEEAKKGNEYKKYGDLLSANMYKIKKGASFVEVEDFYNGGRIATLKLNPKYSPKKNIEIYYKLFKKSKTAKEKLPKLIFEAKNELNFLKGELGFVKRASSEEELLDIALELKEKNYNFKYNFGNSKNKDNINKRDIFLKFCSSDGFYFYVGKNNRQNEILTLKKAKKEDLWLHVSDLSGSHVVIFTNGKSPSDQAIFEAATVAAYYSEAREEKKVSVWYTLIKNVSKVKGLPVGTVIFKNCDTIVVSPNFELVKNLMCNDNKI